MFSWISSKQNRRYVELVEFLDTHDSVASVHHVLSEIRYYYELQTVAYLGLNSVHLCIDNPYLAVTYSPEWITHYRKKRYQQIDPVLHQGFASVLPLDWGQLDTDAPEVQSLFGEAREFGLGRLGLTIPLRGRWGDRALFTITANMTQHEWDVTVRFLMRDLQMLAYYIHQTVIRHIGVGQSPHLSPREAECLQWKARGKTVPEIAIILGLTEKTVRFYLEVSRTKLGAANSTHAVAKALARHLINDVL